MIIPKPTLFALLFLAVSLLSVDDKANNFTKPTLSVDIRAFGFQPITDDDFQNLHLGLSELYIWDPHVRVTSVSDDTLAVYWTRGPHEEVRAREPLIMKAIFLSSKTGALIHREEWPSRKRHAPSDPLDTEGRIWGTSGGQYLVQASDKLMLYSKDFKLIKTLELDSPEGHSYSVQVALGGHRILVNQLSRDVHFNFEWLDAATLANVRGLPVPSEGTDGVTWETGIYASDEGYFVRGDAKEVRRVPSSRQSSPTVCVQPGCETEYPEVTPLADGQYVVSTSSSVSLHARTGERIWFKSGTGPFGLLKVGGSLDGKAFAIEIQGVDGQYFDDISLSRATVTFLVYKSATASRVLICRVPLEWEDSFGLSPTGSELTTLHGTTVDVFSIQ